MEREDCPRTGTGDDMHQATGRERHSWTWQGTQPAAIEIAECPGCLAEHGMPHRCGITDDSPGQTSRRSAEANFTQMSAQQQQQQQQQQQAMLQPGSGIVAHGMMVAGPTYMPGPNVTTVYPDHRRDPYAPPDHFVAYTSPTAHAHHVPLQQYVVSPDRATYQCPDCTPRYVYPADQMMAAGGGSMPYYMPHDHQHRQAPTMCGHATPGHYQIIGQPVASVSNFRFVGPTYAQGGAYRHAPPPAHLQQPPPGASGMQDGYGPGTPVDMAPSGGAYQQKRSSLVVEYDLDGRVEGSVASSSASSPRPVRREMTPIGITEDGRVDVEAPAVDTRVLTAAPARQEEQRRPPAAEAYRVVDDDSRPTKDPGSRTSSPRTSWVVRSDNRTDYREVTQVEEHVSYSVQMSSAPSQRTSTIVDDGAEPNLMSESTVVKDVDVLPERDVKNSETTSKGDAVAEDETATTRTSERLSRAHHGSMTFVIDLSEGKEAPNRSLRECVPQFLLRRSNQRSRSIERENKDSLEDESRRKGTSPMLQRKSREADVESPVLQRRHREVETLNRMPRSPQVTRRHRVSLQPNDDLSSSDDDNTSTRQQTVKTRTGQPTPQTQRTVADKPPIGNTSKVVTTTTNKQHPTPEVNVNYAGDIKEAMALAAAADHVGSASLSTVRNKRKQLKDSSESALLMNLMFPGSQPQQPQRHQTPSDDAPVEDDQPNSRTGRSDRDQLEQPCSLHRSASDRQRNRQVKVVRRSPTTEKRPGKPEGRRRWTIIDGRNLLRKQEDAAEKDDDASDDTYTIGSDDQNNNTEEVMKDRRKIDEQFGVANDERSDIPATIGGGGGGVRRRGNMLDDWIEKSVDVMALAVKPGHAGAGEDAKQGRARRSTFGVGEEPGRSVENLVDADDPVGSEETLRQPADELKVTGGSVTVEKAVVDLKTDVVDVIPADSNSVELSETVEVKAASVMRCDVDLKDDQKRRSMNGSCPRNTPEPVSRTTPEPVATATPEPIFSRQSINDHRDADDLNKQSNRSSTATHVLRSVDAFQSSTVDGDDALTLLSAVIGQDELSSATNDVILCIHESDDEQDRKPKHVTADSSEPRTDYKTPDVAKPSTLLTTPSGSRRLLPAPPKDGDDDDGRVFVNGVIGREPLPSSSSNVPDDDRDYGSAFVVTADAPQRRRTVTYSDLKSAADREAESQWAAETRGVLGMKLRGSGTRGVGPTMNGSARMPDDATAHHRNSTDNDEDRPSPPVISGARLKPTVIVQRAGQLPPPGGQFKPISDAADIRRRASSTATSSSTRSHRETAASSGSRTTRVQPRAQQPSASPTRDQRHQLPPRSKSGLPYEMGSTSPTIRSGLRRGGAATDLHTRTPDTGRRQRDDGRPTTTTTGSTPGYMASRGNVRSASTNRPISSKEPETISPPKAALKRTATVDVGSTTLRKSPEERGRTYNRQADVAKTSKTPTSAATAAAAATAAEIRRANLMRRSTSAGNIRRAPSKSPVRGGAIAPVDERKQNALENFRKRMDYVPSAAAAAAATAAVAPSSSSSSKARDGRRSTGAVGGMGSGRLSRESSSSSYERLPSRGSSRSSTSGLTDDEEGIGGGRAGTVAGISMSVASNINALSMGLPPDDGSFNMNYEQMNLKLILRLSEEIMRSSDVLIHHFKKSDTSLSPGVKPFRSTSNVGQNVSRTEEIMHNLAYAERRLKECTNKIKSVGARPSVNGDT